MDIATRRHELETEILGIKAYLNHPMTQVILLDVKDQSDQLVSIILNEDITSVPDFFRREQALGHLRGLSRLEAVIKESLEKVEAELNALPQDEYGH